ncbi:MAG TPA: alpha/beta fold hydrolase, partial [Pseudonocardiaceae bacterium]
MTTPTHDSWFARPRPVTNPRLRLFCFPHAGAGASVFNPWVNDAFPAEVELVAIRLPGRESRFTEEPFDDLSALLAALEPAIIPMLDVPFALFGHCSGSILAFELVRQLRAADHPLPVALFVSSCEAPQVRQASTNIHQLPPDELIREVAGFGGVAPDVLTDSELMALLEPPLRADFRLVERAGYDELAPLDVPISVVGGLDDEFIGFGALAAWRAQTTSRFGVHMLDSGHFVLAPSARLLVALVNTLLSELPAPTRPAVRHRHSG